MYVSVNTIIPRGVSLTIVCLRSTRGRSKRILEFLQPSPTLRPANFLKLLGYDTTLPATTPYLIGQTQRNAVLFRAIVRKIFQESPRRGFELPVRTQGRNNSHRCYSRKSSRPRCSSLTTNRPVTFRSRCSLLVPNRSRLPGENDTEPAGRESARRNVNRNGGEREKERKINKNKRESQLRERTRSPRKMDGKKGRMVTGGKKGRRKRKKKKRVSKEKSTSPCDSMLPVQKQVKGSRKGQGGGGKGAKGRRSASDSSQILFEGAPS